MLLSKSHHVRVYIAYSDFEVGRKVYNPEVLSFIPNLEVEIPAWCGCTSPSSIIGCLPTVARDLVLKHER